MYSEPRGAVLFSVLLVLAPDVMYNQSISRYTGVFLSCAHRVRCIGRTNSPFPWPWPMAFDEMRSWMGTTPWARAGYSTECVRGFAGSEIRPDVMD